MPALLLLIILSAAITSCQEAPCGEPRKIKLPDALLHHDSLCLCVPLWKVMIEEPGLYEAEYTEEDHVYYKYLDAEANPLFESIWYSHRNGIYDLISLHHRNRVTWEQLAEIREALQSEFGPPSRWQGWIEDESQLDSSMWDGVIKELEWHREDSTIIAVHATIFHGSVARLSLYIWAKPLSER